MLSIINGSIKNELDWVAMLFVYKIILEQKALMFLVCASKAWNMKGSRIAKPLTDNFIL